VLLLLLAVGLWFAFRRRPAPPAPVALAPRPPAPPARPPDYIGDQAHALDLDVERILAFVRDQVHPARSQGVLRGPIGTLWAGAGNDLDRCLLLQALLERASARTRLVHGQAYGVEIAAPDGSWRYAGPAHAPDAGAAPVESLPDDLYHTVAIQVRTTAG